MQLKEIKLQNVRQFEEVTFKLLKGFNLFIGENGTGKSTLLDSIRSAPQFRQRGKRWKHEDIRIGADALAMKFLYQNNEDRLTESTFIKTFGSLTRDSYFTESRTYHHQPRSRDKLRILSYPASGGLPVGMKLKRRQSHRSGNNTDNEKMSDFVNAIIREDNEHVISSSDTPNSLNGATIRDFLQETLASLDPRFTNFSLRYMPYKIDIYGRNDFEKFSEKSSRLESKKRAHLFSPEANQLRQLIFDYFDRTPKSLKAIRSKKITIDSTGSIDGKRRYLPNFDLKTSEESEKALKLFSASDVEIFSSLHIVLHTEDGDLMLHQLSDGQQRIFSLILDIAWNLKFSEDAMPDKEDALVVIDEIDVHLHPRWQREIIGILTRTFPQCQFIATTHSPFVIQSVPPNQVVKVTKAGPECFEIGMPWSIEDISEYIQEIPMPQRSKRNERMSHAAEHYFSLIHSDTATQEDLDEAELEYRRASEPYTEKPAINALLKLAKIRSLQK